MPTSRARVGLNSRNHARFAEEDYELIRRARIETLKTISIIPADVYARLRRENPNLEFIVRLHDDRMGRGHHPTPDQFVARMVPIMQALRSYATKFEIHNEPNHADRIEGWGPTDQDAKSFLAWYQQVLAKLRQACPWASLGFPGLALQDPHRDLEWLAICKQAILASDWLGCHCYWQQDNMLSDQWGLRFKLYHERFPDLAIEITEFGDSTPNRPRDQIASLYTRYYQALFDIPYVRSACAFIASSHDPAWQLYVWRKENAEFLPVVDVVGGMARPSIAPPPDPDSRRRERFFSETGHWVRGTFFDFLQQHGRQFCGYPITEQFEEDGLQTQYFQRLGIEEIQAGTVRLKPVGTEPYRSRQTIARLKAEIDLLRARPAPATAAPAIQDVVDSVARHAANTYETRDIGAIQWLVVHHTATPSDVSPQRLANYQVGTLGRPGISYHFVVAADGTLFQTNRIATASHHAYGRNSTALGVCFTGDFTEAVPTQAQLRAGGQLLAYLLDLLDLGDEQIVGVSEFTDSSSPGDQWLSGQRWKDLLLEEVHEASSASGDGASQHLADLQAQLALKQDEVDRLRAENAALQQTPAPEAPPEPTPLPEAAPGGDGTIPSPTIHSVIDQLPRHASRQYETRPLSAIEYIVIHHTAVPATVSLEKIAAYHVNRQDWPGIGYHFDVGAEGTIHRCNDLTTKSYHAAGINTRSVGISFGGNFSDSAPPGPQIKAGAHLVAWLLQELELPLDSVRGHKEFMDTQCPGQQWLEGQSWKDLLYAEVQRVQEEAERPPSPAVKALYHYLLFRKEPEPQSRAEFWGAETYIAHFHPALGFSVEEAMQAEYVTIVGGPSGISQQDESRIQAAGCKVERIAGVDESETQHLLEKLVQQDRRFQRFDG